MIEQSFKMILTPLVLNFVIARSSICDIDVSTFSEWICSLVSL